jgi:short-subunit dehydrogenase
MNPARRALNLLGKPASAVADAVMRPSATGRNRPFYAMNVVDRLRGGSLEDTLRNRIVLVTGASSGIGEATAKQVAAAGGEVVLVARGVEKLEATADAVRAAGGTPHVYPCDLSDLEAIKAMAAKVQDDLGRVDILVNNAGRSIRRSLALSYDRMHDYERTMQLNYFAAVQLCLAVLPGMRERKYGAIINVSSAGVQTRVPRFGAYIASKAALDTLCDAWQAETHPDNVQFTTVHMGLVRTPMISATTIYDRFPALAPEDAAEMLCHAMIHRPRRVSAPFGQFAAFADAISPQLMDRVRSQGFQLFDDSNAAKGEKKPDEPISNTGKAFAEVTRGIHW